MKLSLLQCDILTIIDLLYVISVHYMIIDDGTVNKYNKKSLYPLTHGIICNVTKTTWC